MIAGDVRHSDPLAIEAAAERAAVSLLINGGVSAVTPTAVCSESGISLDEFSSRFASVNEVFGYLLRDLMAAHGERIITTLARRRSLTETLRAGSLAFWETAESRLDEHQALMILNYSEASQPHLVAHSDPDMSIHRTLTTNCEMWLTSLEKIHDITWERPVTLLAAGQVGSNYGLISDFLTYRNTDRIHEMIHTIAFNLAQYGRRRTKNQTI